MNENKRNFYTVNEFLELMDHSISRAQVTVFIRKGKIPALQFGGRKLIRASFVDDVLNGKVEVI